MFLQLKRYCIVDHYPSSKQGETISFNLFADANRSYDGSKLRYVIGAVSGEGSDISIFRLVAWALHKLKSPVRTTLAAEIFAANKALDALVLLCSALESIFSVQIEAWELDNSNDIYQSLIVQHNSVHRSVRGNFNCPRVIFNTELNSSGMVLAFCNSADFRTEANSALIDAIELVLVA